MSEFIPRKERIRREREAKKRKREQQVGSAKDWIFALSVSVVLAILIRIFLLEPTYVSGPSMQDTLRTGDKVLVNKVVYKFTSPSRGDIIVFHATPKKDLIKRVIGLPGETVEAKNGRVYVNGVSLSEPYLGPNVTTKDFPPVKVPKDCVFVLGDNRDDSADSRILGSIPISQIVGRSELVYWPLNHLRFL